MGFLKPKAPKPPEPSAMELAAQRANQAMLDEEMEEKQKREKAGKRGAAGNMSLLAKGGPKAKTTFNPNPGRNNYGSMSPSRFTGGGGGGRSIG